MVQRNFVMPDDSIVEISDVNGAVRPELQIHRPEPRIIALKKIRLLLREPRRTISDQRVPVDPQEVGPLIRPVVDVLRTGEECVDQLLPFRRVSVLDELSRVRRRRQTPDRVEVSSTDKF